MSWYFFEDRGSAKPVPPVSSGRGNGGYKATKHNGISTLIHNEPEAKIIKAIFDWYINGDDGNKMTIIGIAKKLTQRAYQRF